MTISIIVIIIIIIIIIIISSSSSSSITIIIIIITTIIMIIVTICVTIIMFRLYCFIYDKSSSARPSIGWLQWPLPTASGAPASPYHQYYH